MVTYILSDWSCYIFLFFLVIWNGLETSFVHLIYQNDVKNNRREKKQSGIHLVQWQTKTSGSQCLKCCYITLFSRLLLKIAACTHLNDSFLIYSTTNDVSAHLRVRSYTLETGPAKWFDTTIHQNYADFTSIDDAIFRVFFLFWIFQNFLKIA